MKQEEFSEAIEKAYKEALAGADAIVKNAEKVRKQAEKELDAAQKVRKKVEKEADKMLEAYYKDRQEQFREAARTELLRNLVRMHLETGKSVRDIAIWLDVPLKFVKNIRDLLQRLTDFKGKDQFHLRLEGNPRLIYERDQGRGGTIYFENRLTKFDMWWEFAGGGALIIVEIPTAEKWEERTGLSLGEREPVIEFIAERLLSDRISSDAAYYIIGESVITFFA